MTQITEQDLKNPNRFIAEGLGAPEARILPIDIANGVHSLRTH